MTLPDCPHCDSEGTLEAVRVEGHGVLVCFCSSCSLQCRVKDGAVVHRPDAGPVLD